MQATTRGTSQLLKPEGEWKEYPTGAAYRCEMYVVQEGDGFVAAAALPGVTGRGATESAALEEARKAAAESIRAHKGAGRDIPWARREPRAGEALRVIVVEV